MGGLFHIKYYKNTEICHITSCAYPLLGTKLFRLKFPRSCLDPPGGVALSRAAVAAASGGVSKPWWWEAARGGNLSRRRTSTRLAARASPGLRGPLGGHASPLVSAFLLL